MVLEGYKETEIGVIPEEWEVVKFRDMTKVRQGLQIPISKRKTEPCENCYQYITIQFVKNNKEIEYIENPQQSVICVEDDILMTRTGNTGIVITNVNGVFHNNFFLIDFDRTKISKDYLVFYLKSYSTQKEILLKACATTIPDLNHGDFYSINFVKPPLKEQEKIADILSTADEKIDAIASQIQKAETLKKGLLQKLLSEGIGHSEFKDSELGKIPESWEVVELKSIIKDLIGGVSVNSEDRLKLENEYGILKTSSIQNGSFLPHKHKIILNTEISRATTNPLADHIIFSRMNTPDLVGQSGYVEETLTDLFLPDRLWQLNVKDRNTVFVKWLSFILVSRDTFNTIKKSATGTSNSMKNISKPSLLKIKISLPPLEEQKQIADILSTADEKSEVLSAKKEKYETLKIGLLQKLLSGEVRTV